MKMEVIRMNKNELEKLHRIIDSYIAPRTSSSLSKLLNEPVEHRLTKVTDVEISKMEDIIKTVPQEEMYAVYLKGEGDVHLGMLIFLKENDAMKLASRLLGVKTMNKLDALGRSSISEVGNILMAGSFLNALSDGTGFQVTGSVPGFAIESARAVLQYPASDIASTTDIIVTADAVLHATQSDITVRILIMLGENEAKKLIDSDKRVSK